MTAAGRFAPSPTGPLHVGNLRTALIAWLGARSRGAPFLVRMEDLDRHTSSPEHEARQLADLAAIGLDWDGDVVRQSERFDRYDAAIAELTHAGLTYECFCTRREISAAARAPHGTEAWAQGAYPGTCRDLDERTRAERRLHRPPALRLRADGEAITIDDVIAGRYTGRVDDVVVRRNDGVPAYNLAVVVDDAAQGVGEVVRADDLLSSTPRQVALRRRLGLPTVVYAHVPLVVFGDGERLAKRAGAAVTLDALARAGTSTTDVLAWLVGSLGMEVGAGSDPSSALAALASRFHLDALRDLGRVPVVMDIG